MKTHKAIKKKLLEIYRSNCRLVESCTLLNMLPGSAILLLEALNEEQEESTTREVLADVNIYRLTARTACRVLKSRMDINSR